MGIQACIEHMTANQTLLLFSACICKTNPCFYSIENAWMWYYNTQKQQQRINKANALFKYMDIIFTAFYSVPNHSHP